MDASRRQAGLVSVGASPGDGARRDVGRLVVLIVVLLIVAIVKPWGAEPPGLSGRNGSTAQSASSAPPSPGSSPVLPGPSLGPDQISCLYGLEVVSLVHLGTFSVREWLPMKRTDATGPNDPDLAFARLEGGTVRALGVCNEEGQAADASAARYPVVASAWRLGANPSTPARPLNLIELKPDVGAPPGLLPHIYQPIERQWTRTWRPGRYAIEVVVGDEAGPETIWIGLDVHDSDRAPSSPSP
jgi:hypothetical protein